MSGSGRSVNGRPGAAASDASAVGPVHRARDAAHDQPGRLELRRVAAEEVTGLVDEVESRHPDLATVIGIPVALAKLDGDLHAPMVTGMQIHHRVGHAGLVGWRKKVADVVAPRAPIADDQARALIGGAFFVLSAYYVVATVVRAIRRA